MAKLIPEGEYTVIADSVGLGDECFPQVIVEFIDDSGERVREPRILRDRGSFRTMAAAKAAAENIRVESVFDNRKIVFAAP